MPPRRPPTWTGLLALIVALVHGPGAWAQVPGQVVDDQKISVTAGAFAGTVDNDDNFGWAVASLGDLDGDGVKDIVVGAPLDDDGGVPGGQSSDVGAVWVVFLAADGTVKTHQKISAFHGGFAGTLDNNDQFGSAVANLGDLDGDGVTDIAVGAALDSDGGLARGAVWILFLHPDGRVKDYQKISDLAGGFSGVLENLDFFGWSVAALGDFDNDGIEDMVVGAPGDDDGGTSRGAVWIVLLKIDGTVKAIKKISDTIGGFGGVLDNSDNFGWSVASLGDFDGDGISDIAVGAPLDDDGGADRGAVWEIQLNADGSVKAQRKLSSITGGFGGTLSNGDQFGSSVTALGDLDANGVTDIAVGAPFDDDGGLADADRGALWMLFLNSDGNVASQGKISDTSSAFDGVLGNADLFGWSLASNGDQDGDGIADVFTGNWGDDDGGLNRGAVWGLTLDGAATAHWQNLHHALAGTAGNPLLVGESSLLGGAPLALVLDNALPSAVTYLLIGFAELNQPFNGGVIVPDAFSPSPGYILPLATNAAGRIVINDVWPADVPPDIEFIFQYWVIDPGGILGVSASNAVVGKTP